jgi:hypothetical protein
VTLLSLDYPSPAPLGLVRRRAAEERQTDVSEPGAIDEQELVRILLRFSAAVEQTAVLLEAANDVHRRLVDLHGALTEPLVDLERLLREARQAAERASVSVTKRDT